MTRSVEDARACAASSGDARRRAAARTPEPHGVGGPGEGQTAADDLGVVDDYDLLPDAVVVVGGDGRVRRANDLAARLIGRPREQVLGAPAGEVLRLRDEADVDWWTCMRPLDGDPHVGGRLAEQDLVLLGHRRSRPVTVTARRVRGSSGVAAVVVSMRTAEQRRRLDASRSELVSTVSHELRSPLTSVRGFIRTLLARWDRFDDEQRMAMLQTVDADASRVVRLLGELLDVSRIDAGRLPLSRRMVRLEDLVAEVLDRFRQLHPDRPIVMRASDHLPEAYADRDKLVQVVTNLVENAVRYGSGLIEVAVDVADAGLRITVSDQGGGLDPRTLPHLFTKFARRAGERRSGTGLGLYICRGIVQAHGGRMWAESEPGTATRFALWLPRGRLELDDLEQPEPVSAARAAAASRVAPAGDTSVGQAPVANTPVEPVEGTSARGSTR